MTNANSLKAKRTQLDVIAKRFKDYIEGYVEGEIDVTYTPCYNWLTINIEGYENISIYDYTKITQINPKLGCSNLRDPKEIIEMLESLQDAKKLARQALMAFQYIMDEEVE